MGEKDERGNALFANAERGVGIFFAKLPQFHSYPSDINRMTYIAGWQEHHHHQLCFFIRVETPIKDSVDDDGVYAIRHF